MNQVNGIISDVCPQDVRIIAVEKSVFSDGSLSHVAPFSVSGYQCGIISWEASDVN